MNFLVFLGGIHEVDEEVYEGVVEDVNDDDSEKEERQVGVPFQLKLKTVLSFGTVVRGPHSSWTCRNNFLLLFFWSRCS